MEDTKNDYSKLQQPKQQEEVKEEDHDDEEEALSLCDLPLNQSNSKQNSLDDKSFKRITLGSQLRNDGTDELFEFFKGFNSVDSSFSFTDMCPADDIISCGKLVPLKYKDKNILTEPKKSPPLPPRPNFRKRSESLPSVKRSNSVSGGGGGGGGFMMRNCRSMDYQRLNDDGIRIHPAREFDRNSSLRSVVMSEKKVAKPRWFSIMFGAIMKVPPEMELNDMKNRQFRMNPSPAMFPATDHGGKVAVNRCSGRVSWRILQALSCRDENSVAVTTTTSFPVPQASS